MMAHILFQCASAVCFYRINSGELEAQINKLHRLKRIIACVRHYYSLHPNFAKDTYGTLENYLQQHIAEYDWALLTQLQIIKPDQDAILHQSVLDIA
ncbi:MAG: hypothetical protein EOO85_30525 [Pedobacter sp.]|nr:MAG: hypothetical protein EOO85_30525 [Pedobacter sp.]